ncbi:MAG: hypothetical protein JNL39_11700 [Opitutaceae bacterium]|nr:hypothetical protein [Opitutaceae bacterium]
MYYAAPKNSRPAFAIFTETVCDGQVPAWRDKNGLPVSYPTEREAQIEIAETLIEHLHQFIAGEREFADALISGDFILPVHVLPDGTIQTEDGRRFGAQET